MASFVDDVMLLKVLTTAQPSYVHNHVTIQPPRNTRSSSLVTLARPFTSFSLRRTDSSFHYASPRLWNQLPASFRQPRTLFFLRTVSTDHRDWYFKAYPFFLTFLVVPTFSFSFRVVYP